MTATYSSLNAVSGLVSDLQNIFETAYENTHDHPPDKDMPTFVQASALREHLRVQADAQEDVLLEIFPDGEFDFGHVIHQILSYQLQADSARQAMPRAALADAEGRRQTKGNGTHCRMILF